MELRHFGILGMKWGVRRYQNKDGTLTAEGKKRYSAINDFDNMDQQYKRDVKAAGDRARKLTSRYDDQITNARTPSDFDKIINQYGKEVDKARKTIEKAGVKDQLIKAQKDLTEKRRALMDEDRDLTRQTFDYKKGTFRNDKYARAVANRSTQISDFLRDEGAYVMEQSVKNLPKNVQNAAMIWLSDVNVGLDFSD